MGQSRHQILYSENTQKRRFFLQQAVEEYPIKIGQSSPSTVYISSQEFIPDTSIDSNTCDRVQLQSAANEQVEFTIACHILKKILENCPNIEETKKTEFLKIATRIFSAKNNKFIGSLEELLEEFKKSQEFYRIYFLAATKNLQGPDLKSITIPFMNLDAFLRYTKQMLENDSYFGIIIDHDSDISVFTCRAINSIVNRRCNKDISIKIATGADDWPTYKDQTGSLIEATHDYESVDLDGSLKTYTERQKELFLKKFQS